LPPRLPANPRRERQATKAEAYTRAAPSSHPCPKMERNIEKSADLALNIKIREAVPKVKPYCTYMPISRNQLLEELPNLPRTLPHTSQN